MTATFRSQNAYTSYLNYLPLADVHAAMAAKLEVERGRCGCSWTCRISTCPTARGCSR
ncbi:hypothetical protein ACFQ0B_12075 [Nonomuraea thailandensis]